MIRAPDSFPQSLTKSPDPIMLPSISLVTFVELELSDRKPQKTDISNLCGSILGLTSSSACAEVANTRAAALVVNKPAFGVKDTVFLL